MDPTDNRLHKRYVKIMMYIAFISDIKNMPFVCSKKKKPIVSSAQIRGESERPVGNPNKKKAKNKEHRGAAMPVLASLCVNGTICVALGNPMNPQFDRVVRIML